MSAVLLIACEPTPTSNPDPSVPRHTPLSTGAPSTQSSASPSSSPISLIDESDLSDASLDAERPTGICDPEPRTANPDAGDSQVFCSDALELGFRALRTVLPSIDRLYLDRQTCAAVPSTPRELDEVRVVGWLANEAYTVVIDWNDSTITKPTPGASSPWPSATSSVAPPVARPPIVGAPREVRRREPFPFCGRAKPLGFGRDEPGDYERVLEINRCFYDGVLQGRPVEMILITDVTREPAILRFDGTGFVSRYMQEGDHADRRWYRRDGTLILGSSVYHGASGPFDPIKIV